MAAFYLLMDAIRRNQTKMKLTRQLLEDLIREELDAEHQRTSRKNARAKKRRNPVGSMDLALGGLAKGIYQEDDDQDEDVEIAAVANGTALVDRYGNVVPIGNVEAPEDRGLIIRPREEDDWSDVLEDEKKPNCSPGNAYHDQDGKWTDPSKDKGSWSIQKDGPHGSDCMSGQGRRTSANRSVSWTKRECGRGPGGKGKAPFKCKDGTRSHTPSHELDEDRLHDGNGGDCSACWRRWVLALNQLHKAQKGELGKPQK